MYIKNIIQFNINKFVCKYIWLNNHKKANQIYTIQSFKLICNIYIYLHTYYNIIYNMLTILFLVVRKTLKLVKVVVHVIETKELLQNNISIKKST